MISLDQWCEVISPVSRHAASEPEPGPARCLRPGLAPGVWAPWCWPRLVVLDPVLVGGVLQQRVLMRVEIRRQTREGNMFVYHENIIPFDVWQWRAWKIVVIYPIFNVFSITRRHVSISIPIFRVFRLRSENDDQLQLLSILGKFIIDFLDCVGIESFVLFWL